MNNIYMTTPKFLTRKNLLTCILLSKQTMNFSKDM